MQKCPVCDRENPDDAITCTYCRRYLPKIEYPKDYSLVLFLKKNESLFTILGVFLILAFIFNSPQIISLVSPQPNALTEQYVTGSMLFAFLCLWISIIIFFVIFLDLIAHLKQLYQKIRAHMVHFKSKEEVLRDCSIVVIVPPLAGLALLFIALLYLEFPDYTTFAFLLSSIELFFIEILLFCAVLISRYIQNKDSLNGMRAYTLVSLIFSAILLVIFFILPGVIKILLTPIIFVFAIFGIIGLIRYNLLKKRSENK